jgi:hypothetical protein
VIAQPLGLLRSGLLGDGTANVTAGLRELCLNALASAFTLRCKGLAAFATLPGFVSCQGSTPINRLQFPQVLAGGVATPLPTIQ